MLERGKQDGDMKLPLPDGDPIWRWRIGRWPRARRRRVVCGATSAVTEPFGERVEGCRKT